MDLVILSALIFALLQWRDHADRLLQTVTAFLLCGAVTALVAAPILLSVPPSGGDLSVGASYILVAIMVWDLLISAHLLRCALSMPLLTGIVLAIVLTLVSVSVGNFLTSIMNSENSTVEAPVT